MSFFFKIILNIRYEALIVFKGKYVNVDIIHDRISNNSYHVLNFSTLIISSLKYKNSLPEG